MAKPKKGDDSAPVEKGGDQVNSGDKPEEKAGTDQGTTEGAAAGEPGVGPGDEALKDAGEKASEIDPVDSDAFDLRLERLLVLAEEADFESGSLVGDIRDFMVEDAKHRPKPWSQMSNSQQRDFAKMAEELAKKIIRKVVIVIAEQDDITVHATLKGYSADAGTFKLKLVARGDLETAGQLFALDGHDVVIVSAESKRFGGQRKDAPVMPDQGALEFADGKPAAAAPTEIESAPPGSEDLADAGNVDRPPAERINLKTGMVERLRDNFDRSTVPLGEAWPDDAFEDDREATAEELAAERERQADDFEEEGEDRPELHRDRRDSED